MLRLTVVRSQAITNTAIGGTCAVADNVAWTVSSFRCSATQRLHLTRMQQTPLSCHRPAKQAVGGRPPRYASAPLLPRGRQSALHRRADGNVTAVSHGQHVLMPIAAAAWRAKMAVSKAVSKAAWWPWPFDLESGVRVTFDVGYLCANFDLPRPLCSRPRPDVRDRQTSDKSIA